MVELTLENILTGIVALAIAYYFTLWILKKRK